MIREVDPRAYMVNRPALEKAMLRKKRVKAVSLSLLSFVG